VKCRKHKPEASGAIGQWSLLHNSPCIYHVLLETRAKITINRYDSFKNYGIWAKIAKTLQNEKGRVFETL